MDEQLILNEFPEFQELLIKNNFFEEQDLLDLLANCGPDKENQLTVIIANIELRDPTEIERFAQIMQSSGLAIEDTNRPSDETDSSLTNLKNQWMIRFKDLLSTPKTLGDNFTVKNATKIKSNKYGDVYSMTSRPRGFCVIIDNQLFAGTTLPFRTGSRADAYRLSDVFSQLHFDIKYFVNKTSHEMKNLLQNVIAMSEQLVEHDALAVVILSHGIKDEIYGTDGKTIAVDTILEFFNNQNCPALINKPKMFFLSACRGCE
ncbi:unnamed protein product [Oppiella nova]|uniref:Caspase family p20 domain-containing protein n=1 Tax=Oppiella nova TaxID=334625 RepID=A0A7R9M481_9ACAR|nr:unnamed protein product [Oppiella nova]CAG2169266.1 unnamed protein product [Oppiella nova]